MTENGTDPTPETALAAARLRAGEGWELVVFDRLEPEARESFAELLEDRDFYGFLIPRGEAHRPWKAVGQDTALLLLTLRDPGPLPFFVRREPDGEQAVAALVLDGVLEIERGDRFVSGAEALEMIGRRPDASRGHRLAALSREAVRLAAAAGIRSGSPADLATLSAELYGFHRLPLTAAWARRLPDAEAVLEYLGLGRETPARRAAERDWKLGPRDASPGWIFFDRRSAAAGNGAGGSSAGAANGRSGCKLYVSPSIEDLPAAFDVVLRVASRRGVGHLKVGCDAAGLLRPDKLVLYFWDLAALLAVARELEASLAGLAAHGVPFTAPIDEAGLLSWGSDPPLAHRSASPAERESWRTWLATRLAAALLAAATDDLDVATSFALERLHREGVDVERWVPAATQFEA